MNKVNSNFSSFNFVLSATSSAGQNAKELSLNRQGSQKGNDELFKLVPF